MKITVINGTEKHGVTYKLKDSLSWWGISNIRVCTFKLMSEIHWDRIPEKKRKQITAKLINVADKIWK